MPLLDPQGRILGKLNLFDLFVAALIVLASVVAYHRLSAPYRVAPPYAMDENRVAVRAELQLPAEQEWMCGLVGDGLVERDPRTGQPSVEVLSCARQGGIPALSLRVHAVRDGDNHILFEGQPLLPGRKLTIDTAAAIFEGVVRSVAVETP